jgi:hypothetical protein
MQRLEDFEQQQRLQLLGAEKIVPGPILKSGEAIVNFSRQALEQRPGTSVF